METINELNKELGELKAYSAEVTAKNGFYYLDIESLNDTGINGILKFRFFYELLETIKTFKKVGVLA